MSNKFLSDEWFAEYQSLQQGVEIPDALKALTANLNIASGSGTLAAHFKDGFLKRGHIEAPAATITASDEMTFKVLIAGDLQAALPAVFSGKLKIQGDKSALIKLGMTPDTPTQKAMREAVKARTHLT